MICWCELIRLCLCGLFEFCGRFVCDFGTGERNWTLTARKLQVIRWYPDANL